MDFGAKHLAVFLLCNANKERTEGKRVGIVVTATNWKDTVETADRMGDKIGYIGGKTFDEALRQAAKWEQSTGRL